MVSSWSSSTSQTKQTLSPRRRNASATILWIFVAWSLPLFGTLLYLSFGIDRVPNKGLRIKAVNQLMMRQRDEQHKDEGPFVAWHYDFRTDLAAVENYFIRRVNTLVDRLNPEHPPLAKLLSGGALLIVDPNFDEAWPGWHEALTDTRRQFDVGRTFLFGDPDNVVDHHVILFWSRLPVVFLT